MSSWWEAHCSTAVLATIWRQRSPGRPATSQRASTSGWKTMSSTTHEWPALSCSCRVDGEHRFGRDHDSPLRPSGESTGCDSGLAMSPCWHTLTNTLPLSRSKSVRPASLLHVLTTNPLFGLSNREPSCGGGGAKPPGTPPRLCTSRPPPAAARCSASHCARYASVSALCFGSDTSCAYSSNMARNSGFSQHSWIRRTSFSLICSFCIRSFSRAMSVSSSSIEALIRSHLL
mmetsp:Transcript_13881/g.45425  ORF Transcript_13881/g.45425 Transcript_13881/m.45425 type:complete len:231 (-) Transcript_13881:97-789(-)